MRVPEDLRGRIGHGNADGRRGELCLLLGDGVGHAPPIAPTWSLGREGVRRRAEAIVLAIANEAIGHEQRCRGREHRDERSGDARAERYTKRERGPCALSPGGVSRSHILRHERCG